MPDKNTSEVFQLLKSAVDKYWSMDKYQDTESPRLTCSFFNLLVNDIHKELKLQSRKKFLSGHTLYNYYFQAKKGNEVFKNDNTYKTIFLSYINNTVLPQEFVLRDKTGVKKTMAVRKPFEPKQAHTKTTSAKSALKPPATPELADLVLPALEYPVPLSNTATVSQGTDLNAVGQPSDALIEHYISNLNAAGHILVFTKQPTELFSSNLENDYTQKMVRATINLIASWVGGFSKNKYSEKSQRRITYFFPKDKCIAQKFAARIKELVVEHYRNSKTEILLDAFLFEELMMDQTCFKNDIVCKVEKLFEYFDRTGKFRIYELQNPFLFLQGITIFRPFKLKTIFDLKAYYHPGAESLYLRTLDISQKFFLRDYWLPEIFKMFRRGEAKRFKIINCQPPVGITTLKVTSEYKRINNYFSNKFKSKKDIYCNEVPKFFQQPQGFNLFNSLDNSSPPKRLLEITYYKP